MAEKAITVKETKEILQTSPSRLETLHKYVDIYKDKLDNMSLADISEKWKLSKRRLEKIIRWGALYMKLPLDPIQMRQITEDKTIVRIKVLETEIESIENSKEMTDKEKYQTKLAYRRELRQEEELLCKLKGFLKINFGPQIDKRQLTIVHNIGNKETGRQIMNIEKVIPAKGTRDG